jgi:enoyl-CoA hydratase/carnithine racemase
VAAALLPRTIGPQRAAEIAILGRRYSGREAQEKGIVNWVVADDGFEEETESLIQSLRDKSPAVLRLTRRALRAGRGADFERRLDEVERIYLEELMATEDVEEGIAAFLEKRKPNWKGK